MIEQTFKAEYEAALAKVYGDNHYNTIQSIKARMKSPFAQRTNEPGFEIFGVLRIITALKATPFCASNKEVLITDPTDEQGIVVHVKGKTELLLPGNMVKLLDVKTISVGKYEVESKNVVQYHSFSYDYNQHTNFDESAYIAHPFEDKEDDEIICEVLEKWISDDIIAKRFDQLQPVQGRKYIDFVAQIIEQRMMRGSLVLTLWDGTDPGTSTEDPFKPEYSYTYTLYGNNYCVRSNDSIKSYVPMNKHVYVNVWKNASNSGNEHFERAAHFQLTDGDDLIIMFNVEVAPNRHGIEYPIQLHMRSGHHQGKGVRRVKRHSILGKAFGEMLKTEMDKYKIEGDISDGDITCDEDGDHGIQVAKVGTQTGADRVFEAETSKDFQSIPAARVSTPSSPARKRAKTLVPYPSSPSTPSSSQQQSPSTRGQPQPKPSTSKSGVNKTQITVDLNDPDVKSLLSKLPPHISFSSLVAMDEYELNEYESLLVDVGDWVEADIREFGERLDKDSLVEIIKLARIVKGQCSG